MNLGPVFPDRTLSVLLFTDVLNADELRAAVTGRALDVALLDPSRVPGTAALAAAATRALYAGVTVGRLVAASLHAELVASLYAGKNVGEALRVLGPGPAARAVLLAAFDADDAAVAGLCARVEGVLTHPDAFYPAGADAAAIVAAYRVTPEEWRAVPGASPCAAPTAAALRRARLRADGKGCVAAMAGGAAGGVRGDAGGIAGAAAGSAAADAAGLDGPLSPAAFAALADAVIGRVAAQEFLGGVG